MQEGKKQMQMMPCFEARRKGTTSETKTAANHDEETDW
jgi:hypothetical protein